MQVCTLLQTDNHASTPPLSFYRPDALPAAQPTASKHSSAGTTRRNIHPLAPVLIMRHPSSIYYDPLHSLCSIYLLGSPFSQPLSRSSLIYLLVWDPRLQTPYISSPNYFLPFATHAYTIAHTHTHPFNGPLSGTTQVSQYQKGKTN